jgi:hypothetical protein
MASNLPLSKYAKQMYFIVLLLLVLLLRVGASSTAVADCSVTVSSNEAQHILIQKPLTQQVLIGVSPAG